MYGVYFIIFWGGVQWEVAGERGTLGGQGRASLAVRRGGALPLPAGGEIAEALPVAEEARRFRGSAPIGSHNSGRESVGTTVGKRTPPLRTAWWLVRRADVGIGPYGSFIGSVVDIKRSSILLEYHSFYTLYFLLFQSVMRT